VSATVLCSSCDGERYIDEGEAPCPQCNPAISSCELADDAFFLIAGPVRMDVETEVVDFNPLNITGRVLVRGRELPVVVIPAEEGV
jgi:hypothetical protein